MNKLTLAELRLKQATLAEKAERLTATWRTLPSGAKSQAMHKQIKSLESRAADYHRVLELALQDHYAVQAVEKNKAEGLVGEAA